MEGPNQLYKKPLAMSRRGNARASHRTPAPGRARNIRVAVQYIAAWLAGRGAVPLYNLMEDAATANLPRPAMAVAEVRGPVDDGRRSFDLFEDWLADELAALGDLPNLKPAARLLHELVTADEFRGVLTLPAYELLVEPASAFIGCGSSAFTVWQHSPC